MTSGEWVLVLVGFIWGYFFIPVFALAQMIADVVVNGQLTTGRWRNQSVGWKLTFILGVPFLYIAHFALGLFILRLISERSVLPFIAHGRSWGIGYVVGFMVYGTLTARSIQTRRMRRTDRTNAKVEKQ